MGGHRVGRQGGMGGAITRAAAIVAALAIGPVWSTPAAMADPVFPPPLETPQEPPAEGVGLGAFHALVPARVRDTRDGTGGAAGPLGPSQTAVVDVTGVGGVPTTGAAAIVANVTVTGPTGAGYLTVYPNGVSRPLASNLNFLAGQTIPNLVTVQVGDDGNIAVFNGSPGTVHVIVDVTGWYQAVTAQTSSAVPGDVLRSVVPARVRDTRDGTGGPVGPLGPAQTAVVDVTGVGGVPATGVAAVVANVTVTGPTGTGYLTVYPNGVSRPLASNLNFLAGQTIPNLVTVQVGSDGNIAVFNGSSGTVHVIVDVTGWYGPGNVSDGGLLRSLVPARVRDTRDTTGGPAGPLGPSQTAVVDVSGVGGVPATGAAAVVANVTVTGPTGAGYLTVYPNGVARPLASNLNFLAGQTIPNLVVVRVGSDGNIAVFNGSPGTVHVIVDVTGYFTAASGSATPASGMAALEGSKTTDVDAGVAGPTTIQPTPTEFWRPVQPDLTGLLPPNSTPADKGSEGASSTLQTPRAFPVGDWGYLQTPPAAPVGRLYGTDAAGNITGTCSGTVVARNLVLTAAHCVTHASYAFAPQQFGTSFPYQVWWANAFYVAAQYQNGLNSGADFAFLVFDNPDGNGKLIGDRTGWFPIASDPPGGLKYSIGYPSEGYFNTHCNSNDPNNSCFPVFCASDLSYTDQYTLHATDSSVSYGGWFSQGFGCYMTGGASGGPVFQQINSQWYAVGVNSYVDFGPTYTAGCTRPLGTCAWYSNNLWAPYFNQVVINNWFDLRTP